MGSHASESFMPTSACIVWSEALARLPPLWPWLSQSCRHGGLLWPDPDGFPQLIQKQGSCQSSLDRGR